MYATNVSRTWETYDQIAVSAELAEPVKGYLVEGGTYQVVFTNDEVPVQLELPASVILKVVEAPDWVKGDSATNVRKPVKLETGIEISVPIFIKEGENLKVDTRTGEYLSRA